MRARVLIPLLLSVPTPAVVAAAVSAGVPAAVPAAGLRPAADAGPDAGARENPPGNSMSPQVQAPPRTQRGCLREGNGYFRARIRGALTADLDWGDARLRCEAGVRPGGGIRLSFTGPWSGQQSLQLILGIRGVREGRAARLLPVNLTLILPGGRVFATRGDDRCTVDELAPQALPGSTARRRYRITGRGFCVAPVNAVTGPEHVVISRFDFAGGMVYTSP